MPEDSVYRIGEARVKISTRTVYREGETLRLRPRNFDLLVFLIQRRGRVVTKEEILREVWQGIAVTENSLVKRVSELRKALGDDLRNPKLLKSVPRVGYELVEDADDGPDAGQMDSASVLEVRHTTTVNLEYREETSNHGRWWRRPPVWGLTAVGMLLLFGAYLWSSGRKGVAISAPVQWREVAWWRLDEGGGAVAHDASGHTLNGGLSQGVSWPAGHGEGLRFRGAEAAVSGHDHGALPAGDHSRTLSAWIKTSVPLLDAVAIFCYGNYQRGPNAAFFSLGLENDGTVRFGSTARGSIWGRRRLDDDAWHMVTVAYEGPVSNKARIFIDGKLDQAGVVADPPNTSAESIWRIGRYADGYTDFRGNIKDVRVFARALTEPQVAGLYACATGNKDIGESYYLPVMSPGFVREAVAGSSPSAAFRNDGNDFSGMQLARSDGQCAMTNVEGIDVGQNLRISMEVQVPSDAKGNITQAGPYFRSRIAGPGDGLMGGTSAGYWVQLHSNGMVKVRRLNPLAVVAFTPPRSSFDPKIFHSLQMEARGTMLQVWLDGQLLMFDQGGSRADRVEIPPAWETPARLGDNQGTAGVVFGAEDNRYQIGGQRVRNLEVSRLDR